MKLATLLLETVTTIDVSFGLWLMAGILCLITLLGASILYVLEHGPS